MEPLRLNAGLPKSHEKSPPEAVLGILQALGRTAELESPEMVDAGPHFCLLCEFFSLFMHLQVILIEGRSQNITPP